MTKDGGLPRSDCNYKRRGNKKKAAKLESMRKAQERKAEANSGEQEKKDAIFGDTTNRSTFSKKPPADNSHLPTERKEQLAYLKSMREAPL